jgi:hypothetical protein
MTDTIDRTVLQAAADLVAVVADTFPVPTIHTVTVTLNGQHGGADVHIFGTLDDGSDLDFTMVAR